MTIIVKKMEFFFWIFQKAACHKRKTTLVGSDTRLLTVRKLLPEKCVIPVNLAGFFF